MKMITKMAVFGAALAASVATSSAQTDVFVQNLNVALTGYVQGDNNTVRPVRVTNKDIFTALGDLGAGRSPKLLVVNPVDGGDTMFWVRTGSGSTLNNADVTGFFGHETLQAVEKSNTSNSGKVTGTQYSIDRFTFGGTTDNPTTISFDVQGFTTSNLANGSLKSTVVGTGVVNDAPAVVRGTVSTSGGKTETAP